MEEAAYGLTAIRIGPYEEPGLVGMWRVVRKWLACEELGNSLPSSHRVYGRKAC